MRIVAAAIGVFCLSLLLTGVSLGSIGVSVKETALRYFTADEIVRGKSYMGGRYLLFPPAARSRLPSSSCSPLHLPLGPCGI